MIKNGSTVIHDTVDTNNLVVTVNEGRYTWRVKAFDLAGNESDWSPVDSFGVDVSEPGVPELALPLNGVYLNSDTIRFEWYSAVDSVSGVGGYWIEVSEDSTNFGDSVYVGDTTYVMVLSDTTWYWRVKAMDVAGNEGEWSEVWSFTIDTQAPEVPELVSPPNGTWLNVTEVQLQWSRVTLKNEKASPVEYVYQVFSNDTIVVADTVDTTYALVNLNEGCYTWRVMAVDGAGNTSGWSEVDTFGIDTTGPVLDSMSVLNDTSFYFGPYEVRIWGKDLLSGIEFMRLWYSIGDSSYDSVGMESEGGNWWRGEIPSLPDSATRSIRYYVEASDVAGNESYSDTVEFTVTKVNESGEIREFQVRVKRGISSSISITLLIPSAGKVRIRLYTLDGREIASRRLTVLKGRYEVKFDKLPSGIYFIETKFNKRRYLIKAIVVK